MNLPQRKTLPRNMPLWIDPAREIYFLMFCCQRRAENQLCHAETAGKILETVAFRNQQHVWFAHLFLLMPDHAHALISFPPADRPFQTVVSKWKEWTAKHVGIDWQRDFFEHRLRREESRREKADYILNNPVRAGLVSQAKDWPYVFMPVPQTGSSK